MRNMVALIFFTGNPNSEIAVSKTTVWAERVLFL